MLLDAMMQEDVENKINYAKLKEKAHDTSLRSAMRHPNLTGMLTAVTDVPSRSTLRAASNGDYVVPMTRLKFGERAFSVATPPAWNRLPTELKLIRSTPAFKRCLKTFFFRAVYCN